MSNIINLYEDQGKRRGHNQPKPEVQKAGRLKDALKAGAIFSWADQQRVARQFDQLLKELKNEEGISPAAVAREVGLGGNHSTDSSKRLYTYRLPENANEKRTRDVAKKPDKYFDLAKAVADLSGATEEMILARLFEGCCFGSIAAPVPDWDIERWEVLAELIQSMSTAVIFDTGLEAYYRDLKNIQVRYNFDDDRFETGPYVSDTWGIKSGLVGNPIYRGQAPAVPSLSIARKPIEEPFVDEVQTEYGESLAMTFEVYLDIRLALGPLAGGKKIGPLIEFRSIFEGLIEGKPGQRVTFENPFADGADPSPKLVLDDVVVKLIKCPSLQMAYETAEYRADTDHAYFNWHEVSSAILREVLSGIDVTPATWKRPDDLPELPSRFEPYSAADSVYNALMDGRLEAALRQQCIATTDAFESYRQALRERIQVAESEVRASWQRPKGKSLTDTNSDGREI